MRLRFTLRDLFWLTLVVALAIIGLLSAAIGDDAKPEANKQQLKLNLAPGDTRKLSLDATVDVHWGFSNQPVEIHATGRMDCEIGVQSIDTAGNYIVQMTQKRMAFGVKGIDSDFSFDSDHPVDKTKNESPYVRAFIGLPIGMKLDSAGQPLEVLDLEKLIAIMKAKNLPATSEIAKQGASGFIDAMKLVMAPLPGRPVAIGDKWKMEIKLDGLEVDATHKLYDFRDGVAYVDMFGTMKVDFAKLEGSIHGQIQIDQKTGWLKSELIDVKLSSGDALKVDATLKVIGK